MAEKSRLESVCSQLAVTARLVSTEHLSPFGTVGVSGLSSTGLTSTVAFVTKKTAKKTSDSHVKNREQMTVLIGFYMG